MGIIAVDPTSPFSGGALLGDRVRMRDLAGDPGIFIRSMATRGNLGGLAHATADVISVLDAAGFERILVETVGVGQAEVDIASAAHTTVVVEAPGLGDEVQAIKAGVLEIADLFAVNKADREGADHTVMALQMMQGLAPVPAGHHGASERRGRAAITPNLARNPTAAGCRRSRRRWQCAAKGSRRCGIGSSFTPITCEKRTGWHEREVARAATELDHILRDRLIAALLARLPPGHLDATIAAIARREIDPYTAGAQLIWRSVCMKASIIYNPAAGQWPFRDEVHQTADFLASNGWDVMSH